MKGMLALGHYKHKEQMKTKSVQNKCKLVIGRDDTGSRNNLMCNIRHSIRV